MTYSYVSVQQPPIGSADGADYEGGELLVDITYRVRVLPMDEASNGQEIMSLHVCMYPITPS